MQKSEPNLDAAGVVLRREVCTLKESSRHWPTNLKRQKTGVGWLRITTTGDWHWKRERPGGDATPTAETNREKYASIEILRVTV